MKSNSFVIKFFSKQKMTSMWIIKHSCRLCSLQTLRFSRIYLSAIQRSSQGSLSCLNWKNNENKWKKKDSKKRQLKRRDLQEAKIKKELRSVKIPRQDKVWIRKITSAAYRNLPSKNKVPPIYKKKINRKKKSMNSGKLVSTWSQRIWLISLRLIRIKPHLSPRKMKLCSKHFRQQKAQKLPNVKDLFW